MDNILMVSGQVAINPTDGALETSNIEDETKRVMANLKAILNAAELDFSHVVFPRTAQSVVSFIEAS